jgi:hypothetical protein
LAHARYEVVLLVAVHHSHGSVGLSGLDETPLHGRVGAWTTFLSVVSELSSSWLVFESWAETKSIRLSLTVDAHGIATYEVLLRANILLLDVHHIAWKFGHVESTTNILLLNRVSTSDSAIFR